MKKSSVMLVLLGVCLALMVSQDQAYSWPGRSGPMPQTGYWWPPETGYLPPPESDYEPPELGNLNPEGQAKCKSAFNTKLKACSDEVMKNQNRKMMGRRRPGPACCAFYIGVFDSCFRPNLPAALQNSTAYPPKIQRFCNP